MSKCEKKVEVSRKTLHYYLRLRNQSTENEHFFALHLNCNIIVWNNFFFGARCMKTMYFHAWYKWSMLFNINLYSLSQQSWYNLNMSVCECMCFVYASGAVLSFYHVVIMLINSLILPASYPLRCSSLQFWSNNRLLRVHQFIFYAIKKSSLSLSVNTEHKSQIKFWFATRGEKKYKIAKET